MKVGVGGVLPFLRFENVPDSMQGVFEEFSPEIAASLGVADIDLSLQKVDAPHDHKYTSGSWYLRMRPGKDTPSWYKHTAYEPIASWRLDMLPGCCGVCVSNGVGVRSRFQRKGLGTILSRLRARMAGVDGYGLLLCTDLLSNTAQRRILTKNGWRDIHTFVNPRTTNDIAISVLNL